jgi:DNA-binding GntR family transcriptional regulator
MQLPDERTSAALQSRKDKAYRYIRGRILSGILPGGEVLSELSLSKEIGISRTPVREAMSQLTAEGLLEQVAGRGTVVKRSTRADVLELFELREALEVYAVAKVATQSLPADDVDRLEALCSELQSIANQLEQSGERRLITSQMEHFLTVDLHFHLLLIRAAGNRRIVKVVHDTQLMIRIFAIRREGHDLAQLRSIVAYHKEILDAVRQGDVPRAVRACSEHICASRQERLDAFDRWERISQINLEDMLLPNLVGAAAEIEDGL